MAILTYQEPAEAPKPLLRQLLRLDSLTRPGLPDAEFSSLFAKCRCGLVMTRRVFIGHVCAVAVVQKQHPATIIDLTSDNDDRPGNFEWQNIIDLTMESEDEI